ncbi:hypothetical protein ACFE04_026612 [Oxalis oulophora]
MVKLAILINDVLENTHLSLKSLVRAPEDASEGLKRAPTFGERRDQGRERDDIIIISGTIPPQNTLPNTREIAQVELNPPRRANFTPHIDNLDPGHPDILKAPQ